MPETYGNIISVLSNMGNSNQALFNPVSFADFVQYVRKNGVDQALHVCFSKATEGVNQENLSPEARNIFDFLNLINRPFNSGTLSLYTAYLIKQHGVSGEDILPNRHLETLATDPILVNNIVFFTKICELEGDIRLLLENESSSIEKQANFLLQSQDKFETVIRNIDIVVSLAERHAGIINNDISPYLKPILEQLKQSVKHVQMKVDGYTSYGLVPCVELLQEVNQFITPLLHPMLTSSMATFEKDPALHEKLDALMIKDKENVKKIVNNPMKQYFLLRNRLEENGVNAQMPEFEMIEEWFSLSLKNHEGLYEQTSIDPFLAYKKNQILEELQVIKEKGFPYRSTLLCLEKAISLMDIYERGRPNGMAPPLYHNFRWRYHAHTMKAAAPEYISFPTMQSLGVTEIMKIRHAPIGFIGASIENHYVDGHWQTPLEFWFHDFNHSRRMFQQHEIVAKEKGLSFEEYSSYCEEFVTQKIMPLLVIPKSLNTYEKNIKRIQKAILFEIMHEEALPADPCVFADVLSRAPFECSKYFINETQNEQGQIKLSKDPSASLLAFVFRKLEGNFYDTPEMRITGLGGQEARTPEMIKIAAANLIIELDIADKMRVAPSIATSFVYDDSGFPQGFRASIQALIDADSLLTPDQRRGILPLNEPQGGGFDERAKTANEVIPENIERHSLVL